MSNTPNTGLSQPGQRDELSVMDADTRKEKSVTLGDVVALSGSGGNFNNIITSVFNRADSAVDATKTAAVSITLNGTTKVGSITKNATGEILSMFAPDSSANSVVVYTRASGNTVASTQVQTRTLNVGGAEVVQTRNITRNALREVLTIGAWT